MSVPQSAVVWFRRDLRLTDHPALLAAAQASDHVLGVFVLDRSLWRRAGAPRRAFLAGALADLSDRLDGRLAVLHGDPARAIVGAARHVGAATVHVSAEFTPYGTARDQRVSAALAEHGVGWAATGSAYAVAPGRIRKADGTPYRVFTPFSRAWRAHGWRPPAADAGPIRWLEYDGPHRTRLPEQPSTGTSLPTPTEAAARRRWRAFLDHDLAEYDVHRDRPDLDRTSRMSAYLHLGLIHPRTLLADLGDRRGAGPDRFRTELCWREFYADVLFAEPSSAWESYDPRWAAFPWDDDKARFAAWQHGRTGFPIVDAGMRQLRAEGWMHSRLRMIVASFLVKDLHLPWQWGARHFMDLLVDADVASNNHGWQWTAGSGTDAAPYFRVFNPITQGQRFDPAGDYVRRWVPELRGLAGPAVHQPGRERPPGYPAPMVDHQAERIDALRRYEQIRG
ncbi:MAG TPA: deoxyribodipyrimidine photo-lyase [Mycobacteriales bacterium]|nr:deoxyribodipyrimidine photo-lyase [Mycobacteriales bacterium]